MRSHEGSKTNSKSSLKSAIRGSGKTRPIVFVLSALSLFLILGAFLPTSFADSDVVTPSPSVVSPNSTISLMLQAAVTEASATGHYYQVEFIAVLTPLGEILTVALSAVQGCTLRLRLPVPGHISAQFLSGGAASPLSGLVVSGGVKEYFVGSCSGSDSVTWTGIGSNLCTGVSDGAGDFTCNGASDFAKLATSCGPACTSHGFGGLYQLPVVIHLNLELMNFCYVGSSIR